MKQPTSLADPNVWYRETMKPNGFSYYEYILVYVDDVLVLSHRAKEIMQGLEQFYRLKDGFTKPSQYLGTAVKEWTFKMIVAKRDGRFHQNNK